MIDLSKPNPAYSFMPAACFPPKHGGLGAYVRYKEKQTTKIVVREYRPNYIWLDCPDREIILVSDHNKMSAFVPMDCNFDEYFDFNYMDETNNDDIDILMFNHLQHEGHHNIKVRRNGFNPELGRKITYVADSGGFQLMTGKVEFIDPAVLARWYSDNVDLGMVLDIPIIDENLPLDVVRRLAAVQKANSDIMLDNISSNVELINIVHGISPMQKKAYGEVVLDERIRRIAMGGMYYQNIVFTTNDLYQTLKNNTHYKHLHILGVYNIAQLAIIIKLANSPINNMFITSDASTAIQSARSKLRHAHLSQFSPPKRVNIGDAERLPSIHTHSDCHCKVCRSLKYLDILGSLDGATSSFLLAYHNVMEISRLTKQINDVCSSVTHKDYKEYIKGLLKNHRNANYTYQSLDFIDYADTYGLEAAQKRYQHYLNISSFVKPLDPTPLFAMARASDSENEKEVDQSAAITAATEKTLDTVASGAEEEEETYEQRMMRLTSTYEAFHSGVSESPNSHGKKNKNREKDKKGSGRAAGVVKGAGLKSQLKKKKAKSKETKDGATTKATT
jgi:hypothetical protein